MIARGGMLSFHPVVFYALVALVAIGAVTALGTGYVLERREKQGAADSRVLRPLSPESAPPFAFSVPEPLSAYDVIYQRDLFGTAAATQAREARKTEVDVSAIPLAAKSLRLALKGTVIREDGTDGVAVIEDQQTRQQGLYREGDRIREARIRSILRNNVVINTGERDEVLTIDPEQRSGAGREASQVRSGENGGGGVTTLSREFLDNSLEDIEGVIKSVTVRPQRLPDGGTGFRITGMRSGSVFSALGLRNNDVVAEVNGAALERIKGLLDTMLILEAGEELEVVVRRGSRMLSLKYRIE